MGGLDQAMHVNQPFIDGAFIDTTNRVDRRFQTNNLTPRALGCPLGPGVLVDLKFGAGIQVQELHLIEFALCQ